MIRAGFAALLGLLVAAVGCGVWNNEPILLRFRRPSNVAKDAALVNQAKGGIMAALRIRQENGCRLVSSVELGRRRTGGRSFLAV